MATQLAKCAASTSMRALALAMVFSQSPAAAQNIHSDVVELKRLVAQQQAELDEQRKVVEQQTVQIRDLQRALSGPDLAYYRGTGYLANAAPQAAGREQAAPAAPVGEAPAERRDLRVEVAAVPQEQGVLTPAGRLTLEPSLEYTQSSADRLVFRGFELVPGIQIGVIEASKVRRETMGSTLAGRFGLTDRLEVELRAPFVHRYDRIKVAQQREQGIVRTINLSGDEIGDVEMALRYQLNGASGADQPIYIANLRVKSDSGRGPFDIGYDSFGVATGVATGSGFWGVQPGMSVLVPSDPIVIFGSANYLWNIPRTIGRTVGGVEVGRVDPGDAISASLGFGFALNPRFSFSLGYGHNYIFATTTELNGTRQRSTALQVGTLNFGLSYRVSQRETANLSFQFGMTEDAPDIGITLRAPITF